MKTARQDVQLQLKTIGLPSDIGGAEDVSAGESDDDSVPSLFQRELSSSDDDSSMPSLARKLSSSSSSSSDEMPNLNQRDSSSSSSANTTRSHRTLASYNAQPFHQDDDSSDDDESSKFEVKPDPSGPLPFIDTYASRQKLRKMSSKTRRKQARRRKAKSVASASTGQVN